MVISSGCSPGVYLDVYGIVIRLSSRSRSALNHRNVLCVLSRRKWVNNTPLATLAQRNEIASSKRRMRPCDYRDCCGYVRCVIALVRAVVKESVDVSGLS